MTVSSGLAIHHPHCCSSGDTDHPSPLTAAFYLFIISLFLPQTSAMAHTRPSSSQLIGMDWEFYSSTFPLAPPCSSDYLFLPLEINFLFGCFYGRVTQRFISVSGGTALLLWPRQRETFFSLLVKEARCTLVWVLLYFNIIYRVACFFNSICCEVFIVLSCFDSHCYLSLHKAYNTISHSERTVYISYF